MKFYEALKECVENGAKITRRDWNGRNQYVYFTAPDEVWFHTSGYFTLKNAQDVLVPGWLASQTDLYSDQWEVVE